MLDSSPAPYAALLLRLGLGAMYLSHGLLKLLVFTVPGTAAFFTSIGLPGTWFAVLVIAAELIAGTLLLLGLRTRWIALLMLPVLAGAAWVHWPNGWVFSAPGGGWEYPAFLALASVVQALLGDGAYALRLRALSPFSAASQRA